MQIWTLPLLKRKLWGNIFTIFFTEYSHMSLTLFIVYIEIGKVMKFGVIGRHLWGLGADLR